MSDAAATAHWRPSHSPWIIAIAVMAATFMEVLDTSVANVSLPHIAGNLAVTTDESTWVLTSYLVSNAIVLPMTGWLSRYFGRKRLLITCVIIFTLASILCGMAGSLSFLIFARILQGIGGGAMLPVSQAVLLESFPPEKRGQGMAVFAMGVVVAPILGPTLGGWITDNYSWRWIFYINVPVGIAAVLMSEAFIEDPPYLKRNAEEKIDLAGFFMLAVWLGTLQVILDKGEQAAWFESRWIRWTAAISILSFLSFLLRELMADKPLVDLKVLTNRNFSTGLALITLVGIVLYGTTAALPIFLQTSMGYPALQSGLTLSPRGVGAFLTTIVVGRLVVRIRNRWLIMFGFLLLALSSFWLANINLEISQSRVVWPSVLNGISVSFIFVPLTTTTMGHLRQDQIPNASGLYNLMRNLGGSFGIAAVTTLISRGAQQQQPTLVSHVNPFNPQFSERFDALTQALQGQGAPEAPLQAMQILYNLIDQQARLWAFVHNFRLFGILCLACIPLVLLFKGVKKKAGAPAEAIH
jgi:DHA2 family multidrug resistance protein